MLSETGEPAVFQRRVRNSFFSHAYGKRPREELYDSKADPDQMKNLAGDPAHAKTVKKLREQLMAELKSTNDPRLVDGGKFFETPPMASPLVGKKGQGKKK